MKKDLLLIVLAVVVGVLLSHLTCGRKRGTTPPVQPATPDTVTVRDTLYLTDTVPFRVPTLVRETRIDTQWLHVPMGSPCDEDYYTVREYRDTGYFGDSTVWGRVRLTGVVSQNRLARYGVVIDSLAVVETTHTVTVTETREAPPRNSVWMGATAGYDPGTTTGWGGPSLTFQHKRGWSVEVAPMLTTRGTMGGQVGYKKKLSFRSLKKSNHEN